MKRLLPLLLSAVLISPLPAAPATPVGLRTTVVAQRGKKKTPERTFAPFAGELSAALEEASLRNVPVLIHVVEEDEEANDRYRDGAMRAQETLAETARTHALTIAVNGAVHELVEEEYVIVDEEGEEQKKKRTLCPHFRTPTCRGHQLVRRNIISDYSEEGVVRTPLTLVLHPEGTVASRIYLNGMAPEPKVIIAALSDAASALGPGISEETLKQVRRHLNRAGALEKNTAGDPGEAWQAYSRALELQPNGPLGVRSLAGRERHLERMRKQLREAEAQLVPGSACEAWRRLDRWSRGPWAESPLAQEVKRTLKRAKKDRALKDELRACQLEIEAEELLTEAQESARRGDEKAATKLWRKLLRKKYDGTAAQAKAREARPDLVPKKDR